MSSSAMTLEVMCDRYADDIGMITIDFGLNVGIQKIVFFKPNSLILKDLKNLKTRNVVIGASAIEANSSARWSISYDQETARYLLTYDHITATKASPQPKGISASINLPTKEFERAIGVIVEFVETFRSSTPGKRLDAIRLKSREIDEESLIEHSSDGCKISLLLL